MAIGSVVRGDRTFHREGVLSYASTGHLIARAWEQHTLVQYQTSLVAAYASSVPDIARPARSLRYLSIGHRPAYAIPLPDISQHTLSRYWTLPSVSKYPHIFIIGHKRTSVLRHPITAHTVPCPNVPGPPARFRPPPQPPTLISNQRILLSTSGGMDVPASSSGSVVPAFQYWYRPSSSSSSISSSSIAGTRVLVLAQIAPWVWPNVAVFELRVYAPKSDARNRIPGTNCAEIAVSCLGFRGVVDLPGAMVPWIPAITYSGTA
eukprot:815555-Rhodomonas_salina.5